MEHRQYICFVCGKIGTDRSTRQNRMFCSNNCRQKHYRRMGVGRYARQYKPRPTKTCVHNDEVICLMRNCSACGWNPEVEQKRKEAFAYG